MFDTHCHLDNEVFFQDLDSVIRSAKNVEVRSMLIPAADLKDLPRAREIAEKNSNIFFASGAHPYHLDDFNLEQIEFYQNHPKCIAIGECGLDYFRLPEIGIEEYENKQKECFIAQIKLALKVDKPLILHIREASADVAEILREFPKARGVFHCFNADRILLEFSDRFYYGIGGVLTFKNSKRLAEVLPLLPKERLLLETDAPYLAPHPFRGKRNEPQYIPLIAEKISEILGISFAEVVQICQKNTQRLFSLFL